ncbi:MAG: HAMP domain-containing sensor histidine kinase, partial [Bacteroidota bacterium]
KSVQHFYESQFDDIKSNIVHFLPHEFRTPLNGILGFSRMLRDGKGMPEDEVREIGGMILRSGERLQHLLENMVLFSQLQFWMQDPVKGSEMRDESASSLLEVIRSTAGKLMNKYERENALHLPAEDMLLQISSIHLTKIIEEVVDNALKFSDASSVVTITGEDHGTSCSIVVRDTGRGMNDEQMKNISGFRQFDRKYYEQQGAGLGLTVAQRLTQLYGGMLTIESIEKRGTTVTISLPKIQKH